VPKLNVYSAFYFANTVSHGFNFSPSGRIRFEIYAVQRFQVGKLSTQYVTKLTSAIRYYFFKGVYSTELTVGKKSAKKKFLQ